MTCPDCAALRAQRDRMLHLSQQARLFVEGGAPHFASLVAAVNDAIARADSRTVAVRLAEAEAMVKRWTAVAERLRNECYVEQVVRR